MKRGAGLDLGRGSVRLAELSYNKGAANLTRYHNVLVENREMPHEAAGAAFGNLRKRAGATRVGLTGADLMMRYLPVPEVEDWRLERLMAFEVRELESKSGSPLATTFNLLPVPKELDEDDTILLSLVRESLLEDWLSHFGSLPVQGFTPNAIALYNCYLALGDHESSVTLLANVGKSTLDLALVRGTELYFARSVSIGLDKRDETLAQRLGVDAERAERLVHKYLDLRGATGARLSTEAERVTQPVLPLYEPLPTLLSGMITLCKAQARIRDLALDRVLLTGGGAKAGGLTNYLTDRLRVPVSVWNPTEMVDASSLPQDQFEQLEQDGPGAAVALGLALSACDPELYALEILPKAARKKRDFQERGIFVIAAGVLAVLFLIADFVIGSSNTKDVEDFARKISTTANQRSVSHNQAVQLISEVEAKEAVEQDLAARYGLQRSADEILDYLSDSLPPALWVQSFKLALEPGKDWGFEGQAVPVLTVMGEGTDRENPASMVFRQFSEELTALLPRREEALKSTVESRGRNFQWTIRAHLLAAEPVTEEEDY